ncbi:tripartite tricarboxylate transporter TctB family protein [Prauserella flavalba]|uniref:DUF1468 domain-containing protein n=1 Tax=Prauserella flavalba TaxID=1477506 RepID=A0A318LD49_9PSEU|nr:tripartite tricarboxylate transporter TctB family protein [Prauserella flavalba]PXY23914.1 hypothetical protein BA062_26900 [Prauserella flavalba]
MRTNPVTPTVTAARPRRVLVADLVGGLLMVGIMVGAYVMTRSLSPQAAEFPAAISIAGAALGVVLVIRALIGTREAPHDHSETEDDDLDYVFHTASTMQWLATLAWFIAFFASLYVLGLYATSMLFTVLYLRFQDKRSWVFSGIYAVILTGVLYLAFNVLLVQPVPAGYFGLA